MTSEATEELEVPTEQSADFLAETEVSLRELTPPVVIQNNEASTVKTGKPDEEDAEEDEEISIQIPANTFPPSAVKADGSVDISVTRAKPSQATQSDNGLISESIVLSPVTELNNPVTVTIPVREIAGLEGLEYVLQPGNIPLNLDGNGNLVGTITADSHGEGPLFITAPVSSFRRNSVTTPGLELTSTEGTGASRVLASQCGQPLNTTVQIPGVAVPAAVLNFGDYKNFINDRTVTIPVIAAQPNRIITLQSIIKTRTFLISQTDGSGNITDISSVTVNLARVDTSQPTFIACHNSGTGG